MKWVNTSWTVAQSWKKKICRLDDLFLYFSLAIFNSSQLNMNPRSGACSWHWKFLTLTFACVGSLIQNQINQTNQRQN